MHEIAVRTGRDRGLLLGLVKSMVRDLLIGACYAVTPLLVYVSIRGSAGERKLESEETGPEIADEAPEW